VIVLNKADLAGPASWDDATPRLDVRTCAVTGEGVDQLRAAILSHFGCAGLQPDRPRVWTGRQRGIVRRSLHDPSALAEL